MIFEIEPISTLARPAKRRFAPLLLGAAAAICASATASAETLMDAVDAAYANNQV